MASSYEYWRNGDQIVKLETAWDLVENDLVPESLISEAVTVVGDQQAGTDHLWVPVVKGLAPIDYAYDETITDEQFAALQQQLRDARDQLIQESLQAQQLHLDDLAARKQALATKLGLTNEEIDLLVIV